MYYVSLTIGNATFRVTSDVPPPQGKWPTSNSNWVTDFKGCWRSVEGYVSKIFAFGAPYDKWIQIHPDVVVYKGVKRSCCHINKKWFENLKQDRSSTDFALWRWKKHAKNVLMYFVIIQWWEAWEIKGLFCGRVFQLLWAF